jgi:hypothetical protein
MLIIIPVKLVASISSTQGTATCEKIASGVHPVKDISILHAD